jgi:hypothetical protein
VRITAAKELEGALMARDPVGDLLGARRFGVGVVRGAQRGDEELDRDDLAHERGHTEGHVPQHLDEDPAEADPAETPGLLTPFMVLYAVHDGLIKPICRPSASA